MKKYNFLEKDNASVFIIAEAGINHNGDFDIAIKMVKEAAKAGADAIKFQNFKTEDFIFDRSLKYTYLSQGKKVTEPMYDLCKRCEMKKEWLVTLKGLCDDLDIVFLSTPTSESGIKELVDIGVTVLKNGSDYLSHLLLLKYMGTTGLPVIISTGMAYELEIREAIDAVRLGGNSPIILLHCTSSYPTEPSDVNLKRMIALRETFNLPVGFSDHTIGHAAAIQAVALGACVIEKHFTLDHNLHGPDHWFSLTSAELSEYIRGIREAEKRMGDKNIKPSDVEKKNREEFRLSIVAAQDIVRGQILKRQDITFAKPGFGLSPKETEKIIGKMATRDIKRSMPFKWEYLR